MQPLVDEVVRIVRDYIQEGPLRLYFFGSWAENRALAVSDLDIALETGKPIEAVAMHRIAAALDELPTLRKVDIVDLQAVDQEFRERVLDRGELLFAR